MRHKLLLAGLLCCAYASAQITPTMLSQSTLTANILATGQGLVSISAPFPFIPSTPLNQGALYVDSEAMLVLSSNLALNQLTVLRGYLGTTVAAHNAGGLVSAGQLFQFVSVDKTGSCDPNSPQYLNVTDQSYFTCISGGWVSASTSNGGGGAGNPGGTNGQIQFNNSGVFGGISATGTGNVVRSISPTLVTPALGTPSALVLTNATGLPGAQITGANSIPASTLPLATTGAFGAVKPDGSTITISAGIISSTGGGGGISSGTLAARPACTVASVYLATDQPLLQQLYTCDGTTWNQLINIDNSGLIITGGTLGIDSSIIPSKAAANDNTALNRFAGIAGLGSAPAIANTTGTMAVNSGSTNLAGTLTSSTSGTVLFTLTWASLSYSHRAVCRFEDETTNADSVKTTQATAPTTTTLTATGIVASGDIVSYSCTAY